MTRLIFRMLALVVAIAFAAPALAGNSVLWSSRKGDLVFPFTPPSASAPGTIDNMVINAAADEFSRDPGSSTYYPSYSFSGNTRQISFTPTGTTSYAYVTLASSPSDQQDACVFSAGAITTLYVYGASGQTVVNAASTLAANAHACYRYSLANTTWYRTQ